MLQELVIENIAVIQRTELRFQRGFSVLSGETGAGKSIIIDALNAILGGRVSRELIRTGETRASVTAVFSDISPEAEAVLHEQDIPAEETLVIRRELEQDGRNSCRINGRPVNLSALKAVGVHLINIYGQHDGQNLLNEQLHMQYLDQFGGMEAALEEYYRQYESLLALNRRLRALSMSAQEQERRRQTLPEDIRRLSDASVRPGEQEELLAKRAQLQSSEKIAEGLAETEALLDGTEEQNGICALLEQAKKALRRSAKYSAEAEALEKRLLELNALSQELSADVADALSRQAYAPEALEETERRLEQISRLCIRFGVSADELSLHQTALEEELAALENMDGSLDGLKEEYATKREQLYELAGALHQMRCTAAEQLSRQVELELRELELKNARFQAEVDDLRSDTQTRFTKKGTDNVRFLLSANAGEDLKPLSKVASGGELSRIMLALKTVLSQGEEQVTAIFDEVDAGVSGRAASRVGEKLYGIGLQRQVLCVTHLPQLACLADVQYHVSKHSRDGRTFTQVQLLDENGRAEEIARMNAGVHVTQTTLESARELLRQAEEYKRSLKK